MRRARPPRLLARRRRARARVKIVRRAAVGRRAPDGSVTAEAGRRGHPAARGARADLDARVPRAAGAHLLALPHARLARPAARALHAGLARDRRSSRGRSCCCASSRPSTRSSADRGTVTWRIDKGLLVAPPGRGKGFLRISVERAPDDDGSDGEVAPCASARRSRTSIRCSPAGAGSRGSARTSTAITQLRIHVIVTHAFLRSLARLDLAESRVGRAQRPEALASPPARP